MMIALMAIGFASAAQGDVEPIKGGTIPAGADNGQGIPEPMLLADGSGTNQGDIDNVEKPRSKIQGEGQFMFENKRVMQFSEEDGKIKLQAGTHIAECIGCELNQEDGKLKAKMSNGKDSEIKVMPDQANFKALERLQLKSCNNCSIELKEVGKGDNVKMAYEIKTQKQARMFGIFKTNMNVEAQVDAETGEVIRTKKPWWAFLASEKDETAAE